MRACRFRVAVALSVVFAWGASAEEVPLRPFIVDHEARKDSAADVSFLLDAPAGKHGFLRSSGGHFTFADGVRFRAWGVNLTGWNRGSTLLPPKEQSPFWAAALARLGINCVRFHFLDKTTLETPRGLIDGRRNDTRVFEPDQVDRLDFFIAELKKRGIYSDLNLDVGRTYKEGDGVPDFRLIGPAKAMTYIGDRLLELQREYARQLLTHLNPYTGTEYRNEPAIAIVELVNENSVLEFWSRNWLRGKLAPGAPRYGLDLTPYYEKILTDRYQEWLKKRMTPAELVKFRKLCGVDSNQPVPRLRREEFSEAPSQRFRTEAAFYTEIESNFFRGMTLYLKKELGVKSLIGGTADHTYFIPGQPLLRSTSTMDLVDGHVYWQHPAIWGRRNTPMVNEPLASTVVKLTRSAFVGKPFTVSEVNHPFPNEYGSEMIPILGAYGRLQVKANAKAVRNLSADIRNDFCAITVSSLNEKPISRAALLLLTAGSREQNTGSKWNSRRTLFDEWGTAPSLIEPVTGWIMLRNVEGAVAIEVTALDGAARPLGAVIRARRLEDGWEFAVGEPASTSYLIKVIR